MKMMHLGIFWNILLSKISFGWMSENHEIMCLDSNRFTNVTTFCWKNTFSQVWVGPIEIVGGRWSVRFPRFGQVPLKQRAVSGLSRKHAPRLDSFLVGRYNALRVDSFSLGTYNALRVDYFSLGRYNALRVDYFSLGTYIFQLIARLDISGVTWGQKLLFAFPRPCFQHLVAYVARFE